MGKKLILYLTINSKIICSFCAYFFLSSYIFSFQETIKEKKNIRLIIFSDNFVFEKKLSDFLISELEKENLEGIELKIDSLTKKFFFNYGFFSGELKNLKIEINKNILLCEVNLKFGERYLFDFLLNFNDLEDNKDKLFDEKKFFLLKDDYFNFFEIQSAIIESVKEAANKGYAFAKIEIGSVQIDSLKRKARAHFYFDSGIRCSLDSIEFIGVKTSKFEFLIAAGRVKFGEAYSEKKINDIISRINKLGYYNKLENNGFYLLKQGEQYKGIARIKIYERKNNSFDGILGYRPKEENRIFSSENNDRKNNGEFVGFVSLGFGNLFGLGANAKFKWNNMQKDFKELEAMYKQYNFLFYPVNVSLSLSQKSNLKKYVLTNYAIDLEANVYNDFLAKAGVGFGTINYAKLNETDRNYYSRSFSFNLGFAYDNFDDNFFPTNGQKLMFANENISKGFYDLGESAYKKANIMKYRTNIQIAKLVFKNQVAFVNFSFNKIQSKFWDEGDLFYLGGFNSVRGYNENQFAGVTVAFTNLEYRAKLSSDFYAYYFIDGGYYMIGENVIFKIVKDEAFIFGYGFGIALNARTGILRVNYGLNDKSSLSNGKLSFAFSANF